MHRLCVDDCVMMPGSLIQSINQFVCPSINESTNVLICLSTHPPIHSFSLPSIRKDFNDRSFQKVVGSLAMLLKSILSSSKWTRSPSRSGSKRILLLHSRKIFRDELLPSSLGMYVMLLCDALSDVRLGNRPTQRGSLTNRLLFRLITNELIEGSKNTWVE